jgi:hypothetical protein
MLLFVIIQKNKPFARDRDERPCFRGTTRCSQKICAAFGPVTAAMPARPSREDPFRRQLPRESPKSPPADGSQHPVLSAAGLGNLDHSSLGNQDSSFLAFPDIRCILAQNPPLGNSFFGKKPFPCGKGFYRLRQGRLPGRGRRQRRRRRRSRGRSGRRRSCRCRRCGPHRPDAGRRPPRRPWSPARPTGSWSGR